MCSGCGSSVLQADREGTSHVQGTDLVCTAVRRIAATQQPLAGARAGETRSEGGFGKNQVSKAALLGVEEAKDGKGKPYYKYELLTTAGAPPHVTLAST